MAVHTTAAGARVIDCGLKTPGGVQAGLNLARICLAGLADVIQIRVLVVGGSLILVLAGIWTTLLPGLGQPAAEWRRAMRLLRAAPSAPGLSPARPATLADFDLLVGVLPVFGQLGDRERTNLIAQARVSEASEGARVVTAGETGDTAYFVLSGKTVAGIADEQGEYRALSSMEAGDFFGEIAALTGSRRTANVVAEEPTTLLVVPATALRQLMAIPQISALVFSKLSERLSRTNADLPRFAGLDQETLRDLRGADGVEHQRDSRERLNGILRDSF